MLEIQLLINQFLPKWNSEELSTSKLKKWMKLH